jgi:hypothetical protein
MDHYDPPPSVEDEMAAQVRRAERRTSAVRLISSGVSLARIAQSCGYADVTEAGRDIQEALADIRAVPLVQMQMRQVALTQDLIRAVLPTALGGDIDAVKATTGVMDHQAKLLGLYAPARIKHGLDDGSETFAQTAADLMTDLGVSVDVEVPPTIDADEDWAS